MRAAGEGAGGAGGPARGAPGSASRSSSTPSTTRWSSCASGARRELLDSTHDLLWGQGLNMSVLFVTVHGLGTKMQFLVSTDRSLSAEQIIEPCSAR